MDPNPSSHRSHFKMLTEKERQKILQQLQQTIDWMDDYEQKEPLLRSKKDKELFKEKSMESALLSKQLSQHILIARNQFAWLLTDTMEIIEMAMDIDPDDDEKYYAYRRLKRFYLRFMGVFKNDFRRN